LTNYAACYATGLLVARRLLTKIGLDKIYIGAKAIDGNDYDVAADAETLKQKKKPFKAILDVGLARTTTGNRVFACLKGATDGGLYVPHSVKRFPGYKIVEKKGTFNANVHKDRIHGVHIDNYMAVMKKKGTNAKGVDFYKKQFRLWDECIAKSGVKSVQDLYKKVFDEIRKNPVKATVKKVQEKPTYVDKERNVVKSVKAPKGGYLRSRKITRAQKKKNAERKIQIATAAFKKKKVVEKQ